jgi:hypothetical protein
MKQAQDPYAQAAAGFGRPASPVRGRSRSPAPRDAAQTVVQTPAVDNQLLDDIYGE